MNFWIWFAVVLSMVNFLCSRRDYHDLVDIFNKLEGDDAAIKHLQKNMDDVQKRCGDIVDTMEGLNERLMEFEGDSYE